jgi:predicted transcriptional regulator
MTGTRVTTIRLPADMAEQVDAVARVDATTASAVTRTAIAEHIARRKADPAFHTRLAASIARDQAMLAALAADPADTGGPDE